MKFKFSNHVHVVSSEVADGSMVLPDAFARNLPKFLEKNFVTVPTAYCQQTHGSTVKVADKPGYYEDCDGLITVKNFALVVRSADCIPIVFENGRQIGAIHCGRRSLISGIVGKFCAQLSSPIQAHIFIGPHIRVKNYEIGSDIISELKNTKWEKFIVENSGRHFFDLTAAVISELEENGILRENIIDSEIDTFENEKFFSARREHSGGVTTFATVIYR